MNKSFSKLAFSFALVAVMLVLFAGTSSAQKVLAPPSDPPCPVDACPEDLNGYTHVGYCERVYEHGCVEGCQEFTYNGGLNCYTNCHFE